MTVDKVIVILSAILGAGLTYWFFLMKKDKPLSVTSGSVDIIVSGGYQPAVIAIPVGKTTILRFKRTDSTDCLGEVILGDFKIRKELPLNQTVAIAITPKKVGQYVYSCGMNMYHGKIIVS